MNKTARLAHVPDAAPPIQVSVRCFSSLKDLLGTATVGLTLPAGAVACDVLHLLAERDARVDQYRGVVRYAINAAFASKDAALADGDEVVLITPVSGG